MKKPRDNQQELKKLQDKWYKKLAKAGFEDIEDINSPNEFLKEWHGSWFRSRGHASRFTAKESYFYQAGHFLTNHEFKNEQEKKVWKLHSEGLSLREIAKAMRWKSHFNVNLIIKRLREEMLHHDKN